MEVFDDFSPGILRGTRCSGCFLPFSPTQTNLYYCNLLSLFPVQCRSSATWLFTYGIKNCDTFSFLPLLLLLSWVVVSSVPKKLERSSFFLISFSIIEEFKNPYLIFLISLWCVAQNLIPDHCIIPICSDMFVSPNILTETGKPPSKVFRTKIKT